MAKTICASFVATCDRLANQVSIIHHARGRWIERTWRDYYEMVERTAVAFHELGVRPGVRVAILANTRVEWALCDLAVLGLGGTTVPIYQNSTAADIEYILNNSQARLLVCEDQKLVDRFNTIRSRCTSLNNVICIERLKESDNFFIPWSEFNKIGEDSLESKSNLFRDACLGRRLDETATLMYTSGTTGLPKGVILTHQQVSSEVGEAFPMVGINDQDTTLTFLPYAHVMGRIEMWGHAVFGYTMGFAQSIEHMRSNMAVIKPTAMIAVPRLFEKIYAGILNQVETSPTKTKLFRWALKVGRQISSAQNEGRQPSLIDLAQFQLAKKLVFHNILEKMGGRLRFAISGGAPLNREIAEFFQAVGVLLLEGYGLTETTAAICVNTPFEYQFGTVGKPVGEVQIRIAADGEILVKSKKVMKEYFNDPAATAEAIQDGWFHTGDIGEFTEQGYLRITDRKKELIKTAGGKYVAPQKLENLLKASKYISHVSIHGDREKYVVALITLDPESVITFAKSNELGSIDMGVLTQHPKVRELIRQEVANVNSQLASFESIKNFAILGRDFSIDEGELTPSLKVKRKVVEKKYHDTIRNLYS